MRPGFHHMHTQCTAMHARTFGGAHADDLLGSRPFLRDGTTECAVRGGALTGLAGRWLDHLSLLLASNPPSVPCAFEGKIAPSRPRTRFLVNCVRGSRSIFSARRQFAQLYRKCSQPDNPAGSLGRKKPSPVALLLLHSARGQKLQVCTPAISGLAMWFGDTHTGCVGGTGRGLPVLSLP